MQQVLTAGVNRRNVAVLPGNVSRDPTGNMTSSGHSQTHSKHSRHSRHKDGLWTLHDIWTLHIPYAKLASGPLQDIEKLASGPIRLREMGHFAGAAAVLLHYFRIMLFLRSFKSQNIKMCLIVNKCS